MRVEWMNILYVLHIIKVILLKCKQRDKEENNNFENEDGLRNMCCAAFILGHLMVVLHAGLDVYFYFWDLCI